MNWFNSRIRQVGLCVCISVVHIALAQNITNTTINQENLDDVTEAVIYPHQSSMTLGKIDGYSAKENVESIQTETPICVVGYDSESLEWLVQYREALEQMEAICFIAQIDSASDFEQLKGQFPSIRFAVTNLEWIPTFFGIQHYPVIITQDQVMQ